MAALESNEPPRVRVAALIRTGGSIIVVRHRKGSRAYHLLPGGGVERGETLTQALVREVAEETGLDIELGRPLLINDTIAPDGTRHVINITFDATLTGGMLTSAPHDDRVEAVEAVSFEDLSTLDLRPPLGEALKEAITNPETFKAAYLGSLYAVERDRSEEA